MTADQLQAVLRPLGVIGVVVIDPNDPQTWTFQGEQIDRAAAVAAVQAVLHPNAPAVSQFWPPAQTQLERDVAVLKTKVTGS